MKLTAHQPVYWPWLGLLAKIASADTFVLWDDVPQEDSGYENRVKIRTRDGWQWLTVPVHRKRGEHLKDVRIYNEQPWARKHLGTLRQWYGRAKFWPQYEGELEEFYEWAARQESLSEMAFMSQRWLSARFFGSDASKSGWRMSSLFIASTGKNDPIIEACQEFRADTYIFGALGRQYADLAAFEEAGIAVEFQDFEHPVYEQAWPGFEPGMSALDFLLTQGPDAAKRFAEGWAR